MIRLAKLLVTANGDNTLFSVDSDTAGRAVAFADSREEAETARLAFERVLLPRFTADEAIALMANAMPDWGNERIRHYERGFIAGMRATLEALAAAGAFVHSDNCGNPDCQGAHTTMVAKLDKAGIK